MILIGYLATGNHLKKNRLISIQIQLLIQPQYKMKLKNKLNSDKKIRKLNINLLMI